MELKRTGATPQMFILDVDGVMSTGQFLYSECGKTHKVFEPHDSDGLKLLKSKLDILFITADGRGFNITKKRIVDDMGYRLRLVPEEERDAFFEQEIGYGEAIFMGDGIFDAPILKKCLCGIAPQNARPEAKKAAPITSHLLPQAVGQCWMLVCIYATHTSRFRRHHFHSVSVSCVCPGDQT